MDPRAFSLIVLILISAVTLKAQTLRLEAPLHVSTQLNQELRVKLAVTDSRYFRLTMEGNPSGAEIRDNYFIWKQTVNIRQTFFVRFFLLDTAGIIRDSSQMELVTEETPSLPYLVFDHHMADTIPIREGDLFSFSARAKRAAGSGAAVTGLFFTFNEDPSILKFDSCEIKKIGDQILFRWVPSNKEAQDGYAKLRITLVDADKKLADTQLNFKLQNINRMPVFSNTIQDTIFFSAGEQLTVNLAARDPDNDRLSYNYSPKNGQVTLNGTTLVFRPDENQNDERESPLHLTLSVSDGELTANRSLTLIRRVGSTQPLIGDFTRTEFAEGDSLVTYLNISHSYDLRNVDLAYRDISPHNGIGSLSSRLIFEKKMAYVRVYSKGVLPYTLVDHDYIYNIGITVSAKDARWKPVSKVLELSVRDRPDPASLKQQKDTVLSAISRFLHDENLYQSTLDKIYNRINRPWWKKVAIATGTLSGILSLVQSQDQNKTITTISAGISLLSIMVVNIPGLSEKTLSDLNDKISSSKARIERIQDKESEFRTALIFGTDRIEFDKMKSEIAELLLRNEQKRFDDICSLFQNRNVRRRINNLKDKGQKAGVTGIFNCAEATSLKK